MNTNLLLGGAASIGLIAGFWDKIKTFGWKVIKYAIQYVEIKNDDLSEAVIGWLITSYPMSKAYEKAYGSSNEPIKGKGYRLVPFEEYGHKTIVFWNGWYPFIFKTELVEKPGSGETKQYVTKSSLMFVRGTLDSDQLIADAAQFRADIGGDEPKVCYDTRRYTVNYVPDIGKNLSKTLHSYYWINNPKYKMLLYDKDQIGFTAKVGGELGNLMFPTHIKDIIEEIKLWMQNKKWYNLKGIPWKRGLLLYGPGGTGKTALARAFAKDLDLPIYIYNLADLTNFEFMKKWHEMLNNTPCLALIEDIDNVFHGRVNITRGPGMMRSFYANRYNEKVVEEHQSEDSHSMNGTLNFDTFLNALDGVQGSEGVFTIITTNQVDKIDPALGQPRVKPNGEVEFISTRPGRIDRAIELTYMTKENKLALAYRILGDNYESLREITEYITDHGDELETPSQFQERCGQIAMKYLWGLSKDVV